MVTSAKATLVRLPISTFGGKQLEVYTVSTDVARSVDRKAVEIYAKVNALLMQRPSLPMQRV